MSFLSLSNYDIYNVLFYFILKPSTVVGLTVLIPTVLAWEEMQSSPSVRLSVSVRPFHSSSSLVSFQLCIVN